MFLVSRDIKVRHESYRYGEPRRKRLQFIMRRADFTKLRLIKRIVALLSAGSSHEMTNLFFVATILKALTV